MQQTFSVEKEARINLVKVHGDLEVRGWDKQEISLDWDDHSGHLNQEGNVLTLVGNGGDVEIFAPYDVEIRVEGLGGEIKAQDIRRIELKNVRGHVELRNIGANASPEYSGEAILLTDIGGDLEVHQATSLRAKRKIEGEAHVQDVRLVEIDAVRKDLELRQVDMAAIGSVGGDLEASSIAEALRCGNVGGEAQISDSGNADLNLGNVSGDVQAIGAANIYVGNCGGDAELRGVSANVRLGNVGGDAMLNNVGGDVTAGQIGADAHLLDLRGSLSAGNIGGDLGWQATFPPESKSHLRVGGDATISLPSEANLELQATVGGAINSPALNVDRHGHTVRLIYNAGSAHISLSVGGDLQLRGGGTPRVASASMPWSGFHQEMAGLGQSMAQMGQDLGQGFQDIFGQMSQSTFSWSDNVGRKVEEQMRRARQKAEHQARRAEERAREAEERARRHAQQHEQRNQRRSNRIYVRVNEREWQMDPEHLNDLVNRAQEAAMEGVAGAMEAVERAVNNLRMQHPPFPAPPTPPTPPAPPFGAPVPPAPPFGGPVPPVPPIPPYPSVPVQPEPAAKGESAAEEPNLEAEREAILRMISEGRITPEEGDMLLEGLGE